ncbi:alcohol dehydrogenase catalytic domain-containing protein [Prauserella flavalba]|uniref:alcohol dehydrogenase catalytic domain-containing protein n=1 Tax=Prauserella flavalba TaxID=1477506 RepID=UPI0036E74D1A
MRALVTRARDVLEVEELPEPVPAAGEVKVRLVATGVCHTDLSVLQGHLPTPRPMVLGHEGGGVVEEVGPEVTDVAVGDHVICSIITSCGTCFQCLRGDVPLCERAVTFAGTMPDGTTRLKSKDEDVYTLFCQGTLAEYAVVPASAVVVVPATVQLDALAGLGCAFSTGLGASMIRATVRPGSSVVVIGAGGVGLATMMGAKAMGATQVIAVDLAQHKLNKATSLAVADETIEGTGDEVVARVLELTGERGADYAFDAVGANGTLETAMRSTRPGGEAVAIGVMDSSVTATFDLFTFLMHKRRTGTYAGSIVPKRDIPMFVDLHQQGILKLDTLVDARFSLDEAPRAFERLAANDITKGVVLL